MDVRYLNFTTAPLEDNNVRNTTLARKHMITRILILREPLFISSSFSLRVALDAEFIGSIERKHERIISCPAASVAA